MTGLPPPLITADVNLQDFAFMPLDVRRLRDSRLVSTRKAEEIVAAILLWSASWHQVPASSLPDDEQELSNLAGYGRAVREFKRIQEGALHGFIHCSDGRWYHPVVVEKAADGWNGKIEQEHKRACDRRRKENKERAERHEDALAMPARPPVLRDFGAHGIPRFRYSNSDGTEVISDGNDCLSLWNSGLKGEGEGEGQGKGEGYEKTTTMSGLPPDAHPPGAKNGHHLLPVARGILSFLNEKTGRRYQPVEANLRLIVARLREGATEQELRQVVAKKCREWTGDPKMAEYLRPATLFNAQKFAQYQGELGHAEGE